MKKLNLKAYKTIDAAVSRWFPRVSMYRNICKELKEYSNKQLPVVEEKIPKSAQGYFMDSIAKDSVVAYIDYPGQLAVVSLDIAGMDYKAGDYLKTGFGAGIFWYCTKLIDNIIDENKDKDLSLFLKSIKNNDPDIIKKQYKEKYVHDTIDITNSLLHSEYLPDMEFQTIEKLVDADMRDHLAITDKDKLKAKEDVGRYVAEIMCSHLDSHYNGFAEKMSDYFSHCLTAFTIFDDIKDFSIDRKEGHGYSSRRIIPSLMSHFASHLRKSFSALDSIGKSRYKQLILLGSLQQLEEFMGLKGRT